MQMFGREENTQKKVDHFLFLKASPGNRMCALDPERPAAQWAC